MTDPDTQEPLYIPYAGPALLEMPLLNKGSAFSEAERRAFNLLGLLPPRYETIEEQLDRCYAQYSNFISPINKHIYLRAIQDTNETLFYRLVQEHIDEMMPIIYTPTVGDACEKFSDIYRKSRGLFLCYEDRDHLDDILRNATKRNVKVIVVTDGERILGLGDQGIGGMGIPIGKLSLYTACGGISPAYTLPIMLDVGTNNRRLLDDPMYMGWRHPRISQNEYDAFVERFMCAVNSRWPNAMIQFEDFAQQNATPILNKYRTRYCCFNDDIQGTAAVTVGTLLAACKSKGEKLSQQKIVFLGAGSAGCGIAEQIVQQMCSEEISEEQARSQIYMVDRQGLVTGKTAGLMEFQKRLIQSDSHISNWTYNSQSPSLIEVIKHAHPSILIGVSGQSGLFTEEVIRSMQRHCVRPIILPLSNPSRRVEAHPEKVIEWTDGEAIVATGSPFEEVRYKGKNYPIPQCNNSYIFPGIGLGVIACKASQISDEMLMAASETLAENSPLVMNGKGGLLPPLKDVATLSKKIAFAVAKVAQQLNHALEMSDDVLIEKINKNYWQAEYRPYKRVSY